VAKDLIPPPSPAGRPDPDGRDPAADAERAERSARAPGRLWARRRPEDLSDEEREAAASERRPAAALATAAPEEAPAPAVAAADVKQEPVRPSPYRSRFGFVLGALIGVGLAAIALAFVVAAGGPGGVGSGDWSTWHPESNDGVDAAREIAAHVAPKYRLENGEQIVAVQGGPLRIADLPLSVALRTSQSGGNIQLFEGEKGVMYTLRGLGPRGSINDGKPSTERHLLLRREALELALYTFRYVKGVDLVVALLPPKPPASTSSTTPTQAEEPTQALFYRPGDLDQQLNSPLTATIPPKTPRPQTIAGPEAARIDALTRTNLFKASFEQGQDARVFLVLDHLTG
jgi:hypothetical protein